MFYLFALLVSCCFLSHNFIINFFLQGTFLYMSPEQTGRMNRSVDYRSDLYSLGMQGRREDEYRGELRGRVRLRNR